LLLALDYFFFGVERLFKLFGCFDQGLLLLSQELCSLFPCIGGPHLIVHIATSIERETTEAGDDAVPLTAPGFELCFLFCVPLFLFTL